MQRRCVSIEQSRTDITSSGWRGDARGIADCRDRCRLDGRPDDNAWNEYGSRNHDHSGVHTHSGNGATGNFESEHYGAWYRGAHAWNGGSYSWDGNDTSNYPEPESNPGDDSDQPDA